MYSQYFKKVISCKQISIPRDLTLSIVRDYLLYHAYDSTLHALDSLTRPSSSFPASGIMPISSAYESESVHQFDQDGSNMSLCEDNPASMSVCLSDNLLTQVRYMYLVYQSFYLCADISIQYIYMSIRAPFT